MKYKCGLLIGRFQPLHNGHVYLIKKALEDIEQLTIGIGSVNKSNEDNPFPYELRKKMIEQCIEKEQLQPRIKAIIPLIDNPSDDVWRVNTLAQTGPLDVVVGNNEWVNGIFTDVGTPVLRVPFYKRYILEGKKIRRLIKQGENWQGRVPDYIVPFVVNQPLA